MHINVFEQIYLRSSNPLGVSTLAFLAWMAHSDGVLSSDEEQVLREIPSATASAEHVGQTIELMRNPKPDDLQLACETIRLLDQDGRKLFLQMAIGMAAADGFLSVGENHILRFLSDLMGMSPRAFESLFQECTNRPFPPPGDPSDIRWWKAREEARQKKSSREEQRRYKEGDEGGEKKESWWKQEGVARVQALATLGLVEGATIQEIKSAYRRLAQIHHPDRFGSLGPEAVKAATLTFRRINLAYELLMG